MTGAAGRAEQAAKQFGNTGKQTSQAVKEQRDAVSALLAQIDPFERKLQQLDDQEKALQGFFKQGAVDADVFAKNMAILGDRRDAISQITEAAAKGGSAFDHLTVSTAGARREMLVLAHEAMQGNWNRFAGSIMVLGERMDAVSLLLHPVTLGLGALAAAGSRSAHREACG